MEPNKILKETNVLIKSFGSVESMKNIFSGVGKHFVTKFHPREKAHLFLNLAAPSNLKCVSSLKQDKKKEHKHPVQCSTGGEY